MIGYLVILTLSYLCCVLTDTKQPEVPTSATIYWACVICRYDRALSVCMSIDLSRQH